MAEVRTRASCDRCRSQKLRCVPSSDADPTAPCQRCLKARVPATCFFSPRSRAGRNSQSMERRRAAQAVRAKEAKPSLPGTGAFLLDDPAPINQDQGDVPASPPSSVGTDAMYEATWQVDDAALSALDFLPVTPPDFASVPSLEGLPSDSSDEGHRASLSFDMDLMNGQLFLDDAGTLDAGVMDGADVGGASAAVVDTTALLTRMTQFEKVISNPALIDMDDYPIGDAISLSRCLLAAISAPRREASAQLASHSGVLDVLLATCGHIVLLRIYSAVFSFLCDRLRAAAVTTHARSCHESPRDTFTYHGLRLGQLGHICLCRTWEPAKKAFDILSRTLADIEDVFGFPPPLRVVSTPFGHTASTPSTALLDDDVLTGLTNGGLYPALCEQTGGLRAITADLYGLMGGLNVV